MQPYYNTPAGPPGMMGMGQMGMGGGIGGGGMGMGGMGGMGGGMMSPMQHQMGMGQMGHMGMGQGMGQGMMGQNYGSAWKNLVSGNRVQGGAGETDDRDTIIIYQSWDTPQTPHGEHGIW